MAPKKLSVTEKEFIAAKLSAALKILLAGTEIEFTFTVYDDEEVADRNEEFDDE